MDAEKTISGWWEDALSLRVEWKYAEMAPGEQSVMTIGIQMMLLLCVGS